MFQNNSSDCFSRWKPFSSSPSFQGEVSKVSNAFLESEVTNAINCTVRFEKHLCHFHLVSLIDREWTAWPAVFVRCFVRTVNMKITRVRSGSTILKSACIREMNSGNGAISFVCLDRVWGCVGGPGLLLCNIVQFQLWRYRFSRMPKISTYLNSFVKMPSFWECFFVMCFLRSFQGNKIHIWRPDYYKMVWLQNVYSFLMFLLP